jgi:STE24 endopeptidase
MTLDTFTLVLAGVLVATEGFFTLLSVLNLRHGAETLRAEAEWVREEFGVDDPDEVVAYQRAGTRLSIARRWTLLAVLLAVLLSGVAGPAVRTVQAAIPFGPVVEGTVLLVAAGLGLGVVGLPFDAVSTFRIEERFGFNNQTPALWVRDKLVGLVVSTIIGAVALAVVLTALTRLPTLWPAAALVAYLAFSLLMLVVYPRVIAPLFNDFVPVEGDLREAVEGVFDRAGFECDQVYEMDASRRSSHANAYFVGFGETKRVVLFDTLVEQHPIEEVQAVLAHELAHWKRAHIWRQFAAGAVQVGVLLAVAGVLVDQPWLYAPVGVESPAVGLALAGLWVWPLSRLSAPLSNRLSLAHEREADDFAAEVFAPAPLASALARLAGENLSNPFPHPLYAAFHYTHPPVPERIRRLRGGGTDGSGDAGVDPAPPAD